jgi:MFS transporter, FSR family, fosmidomycin resistance protein
VREGAWPFLRQDFGLSYLQIGSLLGIPALLSSVLDPLIGILADTRWRRALVVGGGALFALSLFLTAASGGYALLLLSFVLFYPASGAFVNISQAELMDGDPRRQDQNMAQWTLAGSAGALVGPLALGLLEGTGFGWRGLYLAAGIASVGALALAVRAGVGRPTLPHPHAADAIRFFAGLRSALKAMRRREVVRWAVLMEIANLMLDVLFGFLALYFVEVAEVSPATAALAVTVWTGAEVVGDVLVIPLLERVDGLRWIRFSSVAAAVLYPCFLLAPPLAAKLVLIALVGILRAGWYAVLQARLYAALPGRSGIAVAVSNLAGSLGALIPLALGALAEAAGLPAAMWVLAAAPLALLVGVPRRRGVGQRENGGEAR